MPIKLWTEGDPLYGTDYNESLQFLDTSKADKATVDALQAAVSERPTADDLAVVAGVAAAKADQAAVIALETELGGKLSGTAADAAAVAQGTATSFPTVQAVRFWQQQSEQSSTDVDPMTGRVSFDFGGGQHSLNVLVPDVSAALTWQVATIAVGFAGAEGKIAFQNAGEAARPVIAVDHDEGVSIRFGDGVSEEAMTVPAGPGSRLTIFFEIIADGAHGTIEVTRVRTYTAGGDGASGTDGRLPALIPILLT